jgi:hypothetical protein
MELQANSAIDHRFNHCEKNSPCSVLTKSSGDSEMSGSLLYPESPVLDELNESLRFISCAIASFSGGGACSYETSLHVTAAIAQRRKLQSLSNQRQVAMDSKSGRKDGDD